MPYIRASGSRGARPYNILGGWQRPSDYAVCPEEGDADYLWLTFFCQCYCEVEFEHTTESEARDPLSEDEIEWAPPATFEFSL
jgi:hypothetical protein